MTEIIIQWNNIPQTDWDRLLSKAVRCSFQQAWAYGAIFDHGKLQVDRFIVMKQGVAIAMGQIVTRRILGLIKFSMLLKGPVWLEKVSDDHKTQILHEIKIRYPLKRFCFFAFSPEDDSFSSANKHKIYEKLEFHQIVTGNSTVLVDLKLSEDQLWQNLYSKNRTHIRKALKLNIRNNIHLVLGDHNHSYTDWLLKQEIKQQKQQKYQSVPVGLIKRYGELSRGKQAVHTIFAVRDGENEPMAGALFLRHGLSATYHIGWNGPNGRRNRSLNLLLWTMMIELKKIGVETLDLGGLNTGEGADIARYKLSFGGQVQTLDGTFM